MTRPDLSLVIPVHNEIDNLAPLIDEIHQALEGVCEFEVIYVNDGSDDNTAEKLLEISQQTPRLRVLTHRYSCGQSRAVLSGIQAARATWIATLDGDGQNDPADVPKLWAKLNEFSGEGKMRQVFVGRRKKRLDSLNKRLSSKIANAVRSRILNDHTPDTGCGLKLFPKAGFLALPYFDHIHRFLPALFLRLGYQVTSVNVNHRNRSTGQTNYGMFDRLAVGIPDLLGVLWLIKRHKIPEFESLEKLDG